MPDPNLPSQKSIPWFSLSVAFVVLGGGFLLFYALHRSQANPASPTNSPADVYTAAALTDNAQIATPAITETIPSADTPTLTPTNTGFPQYSFTQPPASASDTLSSGSTLCNDSSYVSDVTIPDGTIMAPGTTYVKTWEYENTGTCTWDANYQLIFVSGDQMGGTATTINQSVAPYQQVQASVSLTAPASEGTYTGYWRLADDQGNGFGGVVFVKIVVSASAATSTPTTTLTPGTSLTPTATSTPGTTLTTTATSTRKPTHTPTASQVVTATSAPTSTPTPTEAPTPTDTPS